LTNKMSEQDFLSFSDPKNHTARTLLAHFFMLAHFLQKHALGSGGQPYGFERRVTASWVESAAKAMPTDFRSTMAWPLALSRGTNKGEE
jgi:hypothetical protein